MQLPLGRPSATGTRKEQTLVVTGQWASPSSSTPSEAPTVSYDRIESVPPGSGPKLKEIDDQYLSCAPSETVQALTTDGYSLAFRNRLIYADTLPNAALDSGAWMPIFIHDVLMLPGTLAHIAGKDSEADIIDRMTPAVLQGYRALVRPKSEAPAIVKSDNPTDSVHGMVIFGQGKKARLPIQEHYSRHNARHITAKVTLEAMVPIPRALRGENGQQWGRQLVAVSAAVYVWLHYRTSDFPPDEQKAWTFEEFLRGSY
ncbi:hypothetical protein AMS68_000460 [Peltaster fructicola]|uniref:Uncharacterized protein n=1 Tax=Peltaster fructicola TaxID=286661 RepID=A0A6H0XJN3_9PEZI|nr:hypothetical protein AMS68_000460 [Peltaster fructicola]